PALFLSEREAYRISRRRRLAIRRTIIIRTHEPFQLRSTRLRCGGKINEIENHTGDRLGCCVTLCAGAAGLHAAHAFVRRGFEERRGGSEELAGEGGESQ